MCSTTFHTCESDSSSVSFLLPRSHCFPSLISSKQNQNHKFLKIRLINLTGVLRPVVLLSGKMIMMLILIRSATDAGGNFAINNESLKRRVKQSCVQNLGSRGHSTLVFTFFLGSNKNQNLLLLFPWLFEKSLTHTHTHTQTSSFLSSPSPSR